MAKIHWSGVSSPRVSVHVSLTVPPTTSDRLSESSQSRAYITYCNSTRKIFRLNSSPPFRPVDSC